MAQGSRKDFWTMYEALFAPSSPLSSMLSPEEADEVEASGFKVMRVPIAPRTDSEET